MYSRSVSSFCVELSSCRVGGNRVGPPPFFGVKFTGDYRSVAIISSLFRHHSQNSKKPEFFIVFSTFDRDPEIIM